MKKVSLSPRSWLPFEPYLEGNVDKADLIALAKAIAKAGTHRTPAERMAALESVRHSLVRPRMRPTISSSVRCSALVLADMVAHGWTCRIRRDEIAIAPPATSSDLAAERERVRLQLHIDRDRQLASESVRAFVKRLERRRIHKGRWVSIYSLMRDGRELASRLGAFRSRPQEVDLQDVIDPYLQVVSDDSVCEWTGLALRDVWRYFRHTWSNAYRSVPGRSLLFLVRDRAAENHPIVGLGALSSSAVQITARDEWIGWTSEAFVEELRMTASMRHLRWLRELIDAGVGEIYLDDLLDPAEGPLTRQALLKPTESVIAALDAYAVEQRQRHERLCNAQEQKRVPTPDPSLDGRGWERRAETPLFRSKRAETLSTLLRARMALQALGPNATEREFREALGRPQFRQAIQSLVHRAKSDRVGVAIADISVCGSIQPYASLLGGKLVAMMLASPAAVLAYKRRYAGAESVIASSMAGRPIVRQSDLVFLGTTSLYAVEPTQYTRVHVPCERLGGRRGEALRYRMLGRTEGYGSLQFSPETVEALAEFVAQRANGQRVRSLFGEGVNPRLRKIREGLDALGLPSDELLTHGSSRLVYGVALARNFREYLVGLESEPEYFVPLTDPDGATKAIADWWRERWLIPRLQRDSVLDDLSQHQLTQPVRHGARVTLPEPEGQVSLFDDIAHHES